MTKNTEADSRILRLLYLARIYEEGGIYNGAKLLRALAFSDETRLTRPTGDAFDRHWVDAETKSLIVELSAGGLRDDILPKLEAVRLGALENRTISYEECPTVFVCRFCGHIAFHRAPERCTDCGAGELSFREFLPYYYFDPITPSQALEALQSTSNQVAEYIVGLTDEQMSWQPQPGEWGVRGLVWHLLVAQQLLEGRLMIMLSEDNPSLTSLAAWAVGDEQALAVREIVNSYLQSRHLTLDWLRNLNPDGWLRTGKHDEFGQVTVLQQAGYFARHDQYHLPQLERLVASVKEIQGG